MAFPCNQCGLCCQKVGNHPLGQQLDRGDGVCRHYDADTHLCRIYEHRPIFCNVDAYYDRYLTERMSREEWYAMNQKVCGMLQQETRK